MQGIEQKITRISRYDTVAIIPELYNIFKTSSYSEMGHYLNRVCKKFLTSDDNWLTFYAELLETSQIARLEHILIWFYAVAEHFREQELAILLYLILWKLDNATSRAIGYLEKKNTDPIIYELTRTSLATCKKIHREICKNSRIQLILTQLLSDNMSALSDQELIEFTALEDSNLILPLVVEEPAYFRVNVRCTSNETIDHIQQEYGDENLIIRYSNVPIDSKERLEKLMQLQEKYNPRYRNTKRARS